MILIRKAYRGCRCAYPKSQTEEIRWDVVDCNLKCQFCWSPASRPRETNEPSIVLNGNDIYQETRHAVQNPSRTFVRFTGGEPTLYWDEIERSCRLLAQDAALGGVPILVQTNGLRIGEGAASIEWLGASASQLFLFELSMKGTNREEFSLLTGQPPDLYEHQLSAYERIKRLAEQSTNVAVVAVLGIYHSAVNKPARYAFVDPDSRTLLFERVDEWDPRFKAIWQSTGFKWVEALHLSPLGMWRKVWERCGPTGSGILSEFPTGAPTNRLGAFPRKPQSHEYARRIVEKEFWP